MLRLLLSLTGSCFFVRRSVIPLCMICDFFAKFNDIVVLSKPAAWPWGPSIRLFHTCGHWFVHIRQHYVTWNSLIMISVVHKESLQMSFGFRIFDRNWFLKNPVMLDFKSTLLDPSTTYGGNLTVLNTPATCGCTRHTSADHWQHSWSRNIDKSILVSNFRFYTTLEGRVSDARVEGNT